MSLDKIDLEDFASLIHGLEVKEDFIKNTMIVQKINRSWPEIIGPVFKNQTEILSINNGDLTILTSHETYKQEILMSQKNIINELNRLFKGKSLIKKLIIKTGKIKNYNWVKEKIKTKSKVDKNSNILFDLEPDIHLRNKLIDIIYSSNDPKDL